MLSPFALVGLLTHAAVLGLGALGSVRLVPLPRGRRSGRGLVLMALSMALLTVRPRWWSGDLTTAAYVVSFLAALWLLLGPARRPAR